MFGEDVGVLRETINSVPFPTQVWNHMRNKYKSQWYGKKIKSFVIDKSWIEDMEYMCGHNRFAITLPSN